MMEYFQFYYADKMSPASKYIAMARQGFFGTESQETPKKTNDDQIQLSEQSML